MPNPYQCKHYHHTCGCSRRKSLFLNFANANSKSLCVHKQAKIKLQKVSSRLVVLICPRAFGKHVPESDVKGMFRDSFEFDELSMNEQGRRQQRSEKDMPEGKNAPAAAQHPKYLETAQQQKWCWVPN